MRLFFFILIIYFPSIGRSQLINTAEIPDYGLTIPAKVFSLTQVMFHDVVNPPAAARFYAYCTLAAYETACQLNKKLPSFQRQFKDYPLINIDWDISDVDKDLSLLFTILETGKSILPSGLLLEKEQLRLVEDFKGRVSPQSMEASIKLARFISKTVLSWSRKDGYFKLSTLPRYRLKNRDSCWSPTAPEYMAAVEPNWHTIRTFFLDSARQFRSLPPTAFGTDNNSGFYGLMKEVYDTGKKLSDEEKLIANFWDCNPFAVQFAGHMSVGLKKISPGGHWMGITGIVSEQAKLSIDQSMLLHALVACSLHDAFVCCWTEKYECNRIRPETAINRYIDPAWKPMLQTPPFPEYTSGHSVISTTAGEILSHFLGGNFSFSDSTENYIGLPARRFTSFRAASDEACISRLYGGIHFRDAIENGREQGQRVATFILGKLKLQKF